MKQENRFLKILIMILVLINMFLCFWGMRLELEYNKLNKENMSLKKVLWR